MNRSLTVAAPFRRYTTHMQIAALVFPDIDQMDLTGPFEVLSRLRDARFKLVWKDLGPVRDANGLILTPGTLLPHAPDDSSAAIAAAAVCEEAVDLWLGYRDGVAERMGLRRTGSVSAA